MVNNILVIMIDIKYICIFLKRFCFLKVMKSKVVVVKGNIYRNGFMYLVYIIFYFLYKFVYLKVVFSLILDFVKFDNILIYFLRNVFRLVEF